MNVAVLADAACYSLFHFIRVFTELTGHGPYDYLMRRRIAEAAREVAFGSRPLIDIALDYRFESPDGFTRAFRRCFGMTPSEARQNRSYPERSSRTPIYEEYARRLRGAGMRAERSTIDSLIIEGAAAPSAGPFPAGTTIAVVPALYPSADFPERPAFIGRVSNERESAPAFPVTTTSVPGGETVSALASPLLDLTLAREYLYRTVFPVSGTFPRGDCEIVELDGTGKALRLRIPSAQRQ